MNQPTKPTVREGDETEARCESCCATTTSRTVTTTAHAILHLVLETEEEGTTGAVVRAHCWTMLGRSVSEDDISAFVNVMGATPDARAHWRSVLRRLVNLMQTGD